MCQDKCVPVSFVVFLVLRIEPRVLCMLNPCSTAVLHLALPVILGEHLKDPVSACKVT